MLLMIANRVSPIFDGEMIRAPVITEGDKQKRQDHFWACPPLNIGLARFVY